MKDVTVEKYAWDETYDQISWKQVHFWKSLNLHNKSIWMKFNEIIHVETHKSA